MTGETAGWVKSIHETTYGELVGVVIVGPHATDLIEAAVVALDSEAGTARVQPGLIQDDLNKAAAKHRLMFAPDTSTSNRATLGGMVRALLRAVPELPRLRLSSIDPAELDQDLEAALRDEPRLMPHLHLSVQAGDDLVLKRMRRRHLRADVIRLTERLRGLRPEIVFGAEKVTTGAGNDIERATALARRMVTQFGMSERIGPLAVGDKEQEIFLGREFAQRREISERTAQMVDDEVKRLVDEAYARATEILSANRELLDRKGLYLSLYGDWASAAA